MHDDETGTTHPRKRPGPGPGLAPNFRPSPKSTLKASSSQRGPRPREITGANPDPKRRRRERRRGAEPESGGDRGETRSIPATNLTTSEARNASHWQEPQRRASLPRGPPLPCLRRSHLPPPTSHLPSPTSHLPSLTRLLATTASLAVRPPGPTRIQRIGLRRRDRGCSAAWAGRHPTPRARTTSGVRLSLRVRRAMVLLLLLLRLNHCKMCLASTYITPRGPRRRRRR